MKEAEEESSGGEEEDEDENIEVHTEERIKFSAGVGCLRMVNLGDSDNKTLSQWFGR